MSKKEEKDAVLLAFKKLLEEKNKRGGDYNVSKWAYEFERSLDGIKRDAYTSQINKYIDYKIKRKKIIAKYVPALLRQVKESIDAMERNVEAGRIKTFYNCKESAMNNIDKVLEKLNS